MHWAASTLQQAPSPRETLHGNLFRRCPAAMWMLSSRRRPPQVLPSCTFSPGPLQTHVLGWEILCCRQLRRSPVCRCPETVWMWLSRWRPLQLNTLRPHAPGSLWKAARGMHSIVWHCAYAACCQCTLLERPGALYMVVRRLCCLVLHVCCNPNRPDFSEG
jgi:hypothetical protein